MNKAKSIGLDANENVVHDERHEESIVYSLAHIKLNRNCPLPDSELKITSLRLEIPTSNDPAYAKKFFDKIGASVTKLYIEKLGDKPEPEQFGDRMFRDIPKDFLSHFPKLKELHILRTHELDNVETFPANLECLNIRYFHNYPSKKFIEKIRKIGTLKVLKAEELSLSDKDQGHENQEAFVKLEQTLWLELKKLCSSKWTATISICTAKNLLEASPIKISDVTGIIIDPISKWTFESFAGLEKFTHLNKLRINFEHGHADRCLFTSSSFTCPSVKELFLEGRMRKLVCDSCFMNLVQICPNVTSLVLRETFDVESVHKLLENHYQLETFRFKDFRCFKTLEADRLSKLTTLEMTLDWNEVVHWPEMPQMKKLIVAVRHDTKIAPLITFLRKCPNLTSFKISSLEAAGIFLCGFTQLIAKTLHSIEYLRMKIFNPISYSKVQPLVGCKNLKVLHLITFPDYTNHPFHDRTETITFDTELKLFETIPSLNLIIVNTEYGKRQFYRGDLFDLKPYFTRNILKYREPQHIVKFIRTNIMAKEAGFTGPINPPDSNDLSDVSKYLNVEVKARTIESSLIKGFMKYCEASSSSEESPTSLGSVDSEDMLLMEFSTGSSSYDPTRLDGKFTDNSDDTTASEDLSED